MELGGFLHSRSVKSFTQLPAEALEKFSCRTNIYRNRVRKAILNS
jgi:hypothetical protein